MNKKFKCVKTEGNHIGFDTVEIVDKRIFRVIDVPALPYSSEEPYLSGQVYEYEYFCIGDGKRIFFLSEDMMFNFQECYEGIE